ncbi:MAG: DUF4118 domain-containing protein [Rectinemataceae bacterium]
MAVKTNLRKQGSIAVGVGSSPNSVRLVQWAHQTAHALGVEWVAIHVDDGAVMGTADKTRLEENLDLARSMGAQVSTVVGADVVSVLIAAAMRADAAMLVVGRSGLSRLGPIPRRATISDRILREANPLDVVVVSDSKELRADLTFASLRNLFSAPLSQYGLLFVVFAAVTGLSLVLVPFLGHRSVALLYLAADLLLSLVSKPAPVAIFALVSSLAYNFFFIPPHFTFAISSSEDIVLFCLYFLVAAVTGFLSSGLRSRERLLAKRDRIATLLLAAAERLAESRTVEEAATVVANLVERNLGGLAVVYVAETEGYAESLYGTGTHEIGCVDRIAARRCIELGESCGHFSSNLPESRYRFVPARAGERTVAAVGFSPAARKARPKEDDELFAALGRSLALYIEKARSEEASRRAALELESERLAKVLFDSVSHELKTPLTTITGSLSALRDESIATNPALRAELLEGALSSADKLNRVVEDFLSIGRIEAGVLRLKREPTEISDLAGMAVKFAAGALKERPFKLTVPKEAWAFKIDAVLVARLASNLLENAGRYSRQGSGIELRLAYKERGLSLIVRDEGPGYCLERMCTPFAKFRRAEEDQPGGVGLGLAICRGIAEAHGGRMEARHVENGFEVEAIFPDCAGAEI